MTVGYEVRATVAVVTLDQPPVNTLGHEMRVGLADALVRALTDEAVRAIVLTGAGRGFCGGADIREFETKLAMAEPNLLQLIGSVEASQKPVIVAIHGACVGGGLELSLACHYRVAAHDASLALPEVRLGLLPGAGGTQRLPRALGVEAALDMIVSGDPVTSQTLAAIEGQRLIDRLIVGDLVDGAVAFAAEVAELRPLPRVRDLPVLLSNPQLFDQAHAALGERAKRLPALPACIDAVANAAAMPFDEGLAWERSAFIELLATPESRALRHVFMAERAAARIADVPPDTPLRPVRSVAVVGAGTMGRGIAIAFLNAGMPVWLMEAEQDALDKGLAAIHRHFDTQREKGKLSDEQLTQRRALLRRTLKLDDLQDADLVIEAVFEDLALKENVFRSLDTVMKPGAILASNTSTLDVDRIAAVTNRPQDVLGLHFFSPAHVMKLLEVVRADFTAKDVLATVMRLGRTIGKTCVVAGVCDGFIGNRMVQPYLQQAFLLVDEGATPQQVDAAMENFGFAMGPFRTLDLAGNDIGWAVRRRRYEERPSMRRSRTADLLCERGRFGQKTGAGWYDYASDRREARPSAEVAELIAAQRAELGIAPRAIADDEIVQRLVYTLVNEGARLLDEGIAQRASDIDVVYITGYGFPRQRGGPMFHADQVGLPRVIAAMQRFAQNPLDDAAFWEPAPLLQRLVDERAGLASTT